MATVRLTGGSGTDIIASSICKLNFMQIDYDVLPQILLYSAGFFTIYFLCYRKYIYSLLDPLFIYIFTISFSSVLVIYTLEDTPVYIIHFFACHAFLYAGFVLTVRWLKKYKHPPVASASTSSFFDYEALRITVYALFALYALANIVLFYTTGFALLSDEPTLAKVENFAKGFGIILKINWGVGSFVAAGLLYFMLSEKRWVNGILLLFVVFFTALEGSKSSLLRILITLFLLLNHQLFQHKKSIIKKLRLVAPLGILGLFGVFFAVLFKENADPEQAVFAFVRRLLYGADATLYFYHPINEQFFARFHFWDYLGHLLNPILGFLRVVANEEALGNVMVLNVLPDAVGTIVGPNTPYYIEGQIYFGYYGAFVYSAVVGSVYAFIREYFFNARYYSAFWFVLICCICQQAYFLNIEVTLVVTQVFDTCFFVVPTYTIISLFMNKRIRIRPLHY